jgi:hypothetical protein
MRNDGERPGRIGHGHDAQRNGRAAPGATVIGWPLRTMPAQRSSGEADSILLSMTFPRLAPVRAPDRVRVREWAIDILGLISVLVTGRAWTCARPCHLLTRLTPRPSALREGGGRNLRLARGRHAGGSLGRSIVNTHPVPGRSHVDLATVGLDTLAHDREAESIGAPAPYRGWTRGARKGTRPPRAHPADETGGLRLSINPGGMAAYQAAIEGAVRSA